MDFWHEHSKHKNPRFTERYIDPADWLSYCQSLPEDFIQGAYGASEEGRAIPHFQWGKGNIRVLIWSQMHGNEPTATQALSDLFLLLSETESPEVKQWHEHLTLHFIPMLNPDGSARYQRRNALGIDINRDAVAQQSAESQFFWSKVEEINPEIGFNLHDQRTMYSAGDSSHPATISFLAPSPDTAQSQTACRIRAMQLIGHMTQCLRPHLGECIGRYSDEFYPTAFGDNLQRKGVATILIESGESRNTPEREETRQANFLCLAEALSKLCQGELNEAHRNEYLRIPENQTHFYDIVLEGITLDHYTIDVGLRATEVLRDRRVVKSYQVADAGDLSFAPRFRTHNMKGWTGSAQWTLEEKPQAVFQKEGETLRVDEWGVHLNPTE